MPACNAVIPVYAKELRQFLASVKVLGFVRICNGEANYHAGSFDDAAKWVNMIRQRAGLPATNATGTALRDVIYKERQREFAYEFKAWTDIKRGYSPAEIKAIMVADGATMYGDEDLLLPIPHTQYLLNPEGLYQNPGYTD